MKNKSFRTVLILFFLIFSSTLRAQSSSLQIHHLGLADGDATLFVIIDTTVADEFTPSRLDTTVILIDAQREYCAKPMYEYIDSILTQVLHRKILDYVVVSHIHIDHFGSMQVVLDTLLNRGDSITLLVDRFNIGNSKVDVSGGVIDSCYDYITPPDLSNSATTYQTFARTSQSDNFFGWTYILPGNDLLYHKNLTNFSMTCLSAFGSCLNGTGSDSIFLPRVRKRPWNGYYRPKSENDLSFSFLLTFGTFKYFTGGDLGGGVAGKYADAETPICDYLKARYDSNFHTCGLKVNHHGSQYSTNDYFVSTMNPTLAVFPAACRTFNGTQLPNTSVINKFKAANDSVRYTLIPTNPSVSPDNWNLGYLQDVIITISNTPLPGASIPMNIALRRRNSATRMLDGTVVNEVIVCNHTHSLN